MYKGISIVYNLIMGTILLLLWLKDKDKHRVLLLRAVYHTLLSMSAGFIMTYVLLSFDGKWITGLTMFVVGILVIFISLKESIAAYRRYTTIRETYHKRTK